MKTGEFAQRYGPWAVIAGASEGVGASLADQLASRGIHLVVIARNEAKLKQLAADVRERARLLSKSPPRSGGGL